MTSTYTVLAVTEKATISYYSGRKMIVRGYRVVTPTGMFGKGFIQGTAQKWSPALDAKLKKGAEEFAQTLNDHFGLRAAA